MTAVAHISYVGGGMFLPDHGPGDRHTIIEYVIRLIRSKQKVQVLLENQRWLVHSGALVRCANCDLLTSTGCHEATKDHERYCLNCALGYTSSPERLRVTPRERHLTLTFARA